jgi:predicted nucleic acid-binding protein
LRAATFIDTSYFLALVNSRDKYHQLALQISEQVAPPFVTSVAVLLEVGNALSRLPARALGIRVLQQIREDTEIEIVTVDQHLFDEAVALYQSRTDKPWGLTDCTSFVLMKQRGLTQALTTDHHFEQAGFTRLVPVL